MKRILAVLILSLITAYPVVVLFGLRTLPLSYLGLMLVSLALLRLWFVRGDTDKQTVPIILTLTLLLVAVYTLLSGEPQGLRFYPVAVNGTLLLTFASSLHSPMPIIERLARIQDPDLPAAAVVYTRRVTLLWCGFFLVNGLAALYTALYSSFEIWALYNGGIAYALMGLLFGGEWLVRRRVRRAINVQT